MDTFFPSLIFVAAILIALNGMDDLMIDFVFHCRRTYRSLTIFRKHRRSTAVDLVVHHEPHAAILVPTWSEATVIGPMLRHLRAHLNYTNYRVYVGVYANDPDTLGAIEALPGHQPSWLLPVVLPHDGPTTKADCLNHLFRAARNSFPDFYMLHDAEDVIHPRSLTVCAYLLDRAVMVQLPVMALERPWYALIGGHYMDEFAESHGKELQVREAMARHVPGAGVGCAIAARAMEEVAQERQGRPFLESALTEDYEFALCLHSRGQRVILAYLRAGPGEAPVATREYFPNSFTGAIRQKARWYLGIAFQGWRQLGWMGGIGTVYSLFRDRKAPFAALLTLFGYGLLPGLIFLPKTLTHLPLIKPLLWFNLIVLLWRLLHRMAFTAGLYGPVHGIMSVPRCFVGNVINAAAAMRAITLGLKALVRRRPLRWDKTRHHFPDAVTLRPYRERLGQLLLADQQLSQDQLRQALRIQRRQGERLGDILVAQGWVSRHRVERAQRRQK